MPATSTTAPTTIVIGAGAFGIWIAWHLHRAGHKVTVFDAVGPAHSGASSGGESRILRCGYGDEDLYTEWAQRSLSAWQALSERASLPLFHPTGVLWLHEEGDEMVAANARALQRHGVPFSHCSVAELRSRYPVLQLADGEAGFFEHSGGAAMARRAVQQLAYELQQAGVGFIGAKVCAIHREQAEKNALPAIQTQDGTLYQAEHFIFACGPWLDKTCPDALASRLFVTRQEIFFFATEAQETAGLPIWVDLPYYGIPNLEGRGFKIANHNLGSPADMDTIQRQPSVEGEQAMRVYLARRFPSLAHKPVSETRVCQYENSANGDFILDRHPGFDNVWLAGGGSGHGYKHGPAVGAYVTGLVTGHEQPIPRFSLANKATIQERKIH